MRFLGALLALIVAGSASAQHPFTAAAELSLGNALGFAPSARYDNQNQLTARLAIGGRIALTNRTGIFADIDAEGIGFMEGDKLLLCNPGPLGGCLHDFPDFGGYVVLMGASQRVLPRLDIRAGVGPGFYNMNAGEHTTAFVAAIEATADMFSHVGVNFAVRDVFLAYRGERFRVMPLTIGLRVH